MAFLRIKRVKSKEYGYLVESSWTELGSRQKVKTYLGRVYRFESKNNIDFVSYIEVNSIEEYIANSEKGKVMADLIDYELLRHGIDKNEFKIDFEDRRVRRKNKEVCIKINDGLLCGKTLANLLDFKLDAKEEEIEEGIGYKLARAFVEVGIKVPHEVFIGLFEKMRGKEEEQD